MRRINCWDVATNQFGYAIGEPTLAVAVVLPPHKPVPQVVVHNGTAYVPSNKPGEYINATTYITAG